MRRAVTSAILGAFVGMTAAPQGALAAHNDSDAVTAKEYALYMDWNDGRRDPRLAKFDDAMKLRKIAKNLGVAVGEMKAAIARVEPLAASLAATTQEAIRTALQDTPLRGRVLDVLVDAGQSHVVASVKWRCGALADLEKEAAYAGWASGQAGGIVGTTAIWCVNEKNTKLFSATAANVGLGRINKAAIPRFAKARYIRLFEGVKTGPHR